jgi:hypothetical protein
MTVENCVYCESLINNEYNFCVQCEKQIKCLKCGEFLLANKTKCLKCGTLITNDDRPQSLLNQLTLEESQTKNSSSRSIKGSLSDTAIVHIASLLSSGMSRPVSGNKARKTDAAAGQVALPFMEENVDSITNQENTTNGSLHFQSGTDKVLKYFVKDGSSLATKTIDFKGSNKKEQQIRLMLLFVAAYTAIYGKPVPNQQTIFDSLERNNMLDINAKAKHYKFVETNYLMQVESGYSLKIEGEKEVEKIINEMEDKTKIGFTDWDKPGKTRANKALDDENNKKIKEWLETDLNIGTFDIRTLQTPTKYALFGLYLLSVILKVGKAFSYSVVYEYLSKKFTIPVGKDAIRKALSAKGNASRFEKSSDGSYYLTPTGEKEVAAFFDPELK